jgi:hypothetical protein
LSSNEFVAFKKVFVVAELCPSLSAAERFVVFAGVQLLGELSSKFSEIARPDRLPYASHSVKEEGQIVMRQQNAREHLARDAKMSQVGARMSPAN